MRRTSTCVSAFVGGLLCFSAVGCGGDDEPSTPTVSFSEDVVPLFATDPWYGSMFGGRCVSCHHAGSPTGADATIPFDPTVGLVGVPSAWKGSAGVLRVDPGNPENSFLIDKISRTNLDPATEGGPMPLAIPRLTSAEVEAIRTWIANGAQNDASFAANVAPIFGDGESVMTAGKCSICHYPGSPTGLDLTNPFDPETGVVSVASAWRKSTGGLRVAPGDPDASFLMDKISRTDLDPMTEGQPMPIVYPRLTAAEVETVRTWIAEGARNN